MNSLDTLRFRVSAFFMLRNQTAYRWYCSYWSIKDTSLAPGSRLLMARPSGPIQERPRRRFGPRDVAERRRRQREEARLPDPPRSPVRLLGPCAPQAVVQTIKGNSKARPSRSAGPSGVVRKTREELGSKIGISITVPPLFLSSQTALKIQAIWPHPKPGDPFPTYLLSLRPTFQANIRAYSSRETRLEER